MLPDLREFALGVALQTNYLPLYPKTMEDQEAAESHEARNFFLEREGDAWFRRNPPSGEFHDLVAEFLEYSLGKNAVLATCLEVGCSDGRLLQLISRKFKCTSGLGIDPSKAAIEQAKETRSATLDFQVGTGDHIPSSDSSHSLVVAGFFLYVVDRSLYMRVISELDRVLTPGGFLLIIDFDSSMPLKTQYRQQEGIYSYRNSNSEVFLSTHHYSLAAKKSLSHDSNVFEKVPHERISLIIAL